MGECPSWYRLIRAAKYLGVAPWDLASQPHTWVNMAEAAQDAEAHAEAMHEQRRRRLQGG